ncbi:hypothetical protein BGX38DRAFT_1268630 [Terfezia claveryi]|nr:hypothetical protein BGX38DRAFT_1268630 [Terfezia claveryi]
MPRKAGRKTAALKRRSWALSDGLVTRMEKEVKTVGKQRPEIEGDEAQISKDVDKMEKEMEGKPWPTDRALNQMFCKPPSKEEMTELLRQLAANKRSGTVYRIAAQQRPLPQ